jgi:hypothetical protein
MVRPGAAGFDKVRDGLQWGVAYRYRSRVLEELARHGLVPLPGTSPQQLRDAVRELYKYEIRRLRDARLAGRIPKHDYAAHVVRLRQRYPVLSLPLESWLEPPP